MHWTHYALWTSVRHSCVHIWFHYPVQEMRLQPAGDQLQRVTSITLNSKESSVVFEAHPVSGQPLAHP